MRLSNQKEMENQPEAAGTKSDDGSSGTVGDKNTAVESFKERIEWKEEEVIALRKVFAKEIESKSVTMAAVKNKTEGHPTLSDLSLRRVYDKIRSE